MGHFPVVVYTMGKVGSTAAYKGLLDSKVSPLVYHVHFLTRSNLDGVLEKYSKRMSSATRKRVGFKNLIDGRVDHLKASSVVLKTFNETHRKKWIIITLVRDPVATFLSHTFQNPYIHRPFLINQAGFLDKEKTEAYIYDYFSSFRADKDYITKWFDNEFYKFTGVDVFAHDYDVSEGYTVIRRKRFDVAVISLMRLEDNLSKVLRKLANTEKTVKVPKENVREWSDQQGFYKDLKKRIVLPVDILERVYSTKFAKHFFSLDYRRQMTEKWSKPRD